MGLVGAAGASRSFLARMPSLHARLGPIKGVTYPAARRLAVALRAGFAVPYYSALEFCPVIWISVPESSLDHVARDLAEQTPIHKTSIVVCGTPRESASFDVLHARGARVATLNLLDQSWQSAFVSEGHREAVRHIRKLLTEDHRRMFELCTGGKDAFLAGVHMANELLRPWISGAVDCLAASGIPRVEAVSIAESLAGRAFRAHAKAGGQPWSVPACEEMTLALEQRVDRLRKSSQKRARLYAEGLLLALEYFQRGPSPKKPAVRHAAAGHNQ